MSWLLRPSVTAPDPRNVREDFSVRAEPSTKVLEPAAHLTQVDGAHEPDLYIQDSDSIWISQQRDLQGGPGYAHLSSNLSGVLASQPRLATGPPGRITSVFDDTLTTQEYDAGNQTAETRNSSVDRSAGSIDAVPVFAGFGASGGDAGGPIAFSAAPAQSYEHQGSTSAAPRLPLRKSSAAAPAPSVQTARGTQPPARKRPAAAPAGRSELPKQPRNSTQMSIPQGQRAVSVASFPALPLDMYKDFAAANWPQSLQGLGAALDGRGNLSATSEILELPYMMSLSLSVGEAALPSTLLHAPRCTHAELLLQVQAAHHIAIVPVGTLCTPEGVLGFAIKLQGADVLQQFVFLPCAIWLKAVPSSFVLAARTAETTPLQPQGPALKAAQPSNSPAIDIFDDLLGMDSFDMDDLLVRTAPGQGQANAPSAASNPKPGGQTHEWTAWHEAWATMIAILSAAGKRGTCAVASMKHLLYPALQALEQYGWPTPGTENPTRLEWRIALPAVCGAILPADFPGEWVLDASVAAWLLNEEASVDDGSFSVAECVQRHCPGRNNSQTPADTASPIRAELDMLLSLGPVLRAKLRRLCMGRTYDSVAGQLTPVLAEMELQGICFDPEVCTAAESTIQRRLDTLERKAHDCAGQVFMVTSAKECARVLYEDLGLSATEGRRWNPAQPKKMHKSTAEGMLLQLAMQHPLPVYILAHRKLSKVLNGFVTPLLKLAVPFSESRANQCAASLQGLWRSTLSGPDSLLHAPARQGIHRIFTQLNQTSTGTGRLSSSNPNLQNLPKRSLVPAGGVSGATPVLVTGGSSASVHSAAPDTATGGYMHLLEPLVEGACVEIRSAFTSSSDSTVLLAMDYSQVEMRVLAHCCGDAALIEVFNAAARTTAGGGSDVYRRLASNVFRIPVDEVSAPQRSQAKTVALGLVYGLGSQELSRKLGVSGAQANEIQSVFMRTYPGIKRFMASARSFAAKHGFVLTMSGRRRHLPDITSSHAGKRTYAERQAVNSIIQGSAADLIACAMVRLSASTAAARLEVQSGADAGAGNAEPRLESLALSQSKLLLQIHDELLAECPKDQALCQAYVRRLRRVMETEAPALLQQVAAPARAQILASTSSKVTASDLCSILGATADMQVPLRTTAQVGKNWGSMVAVDAS